MAFGFLATMLCWCLKIKCSLGRMFQSEGAAGGKVRKALGWQHLASTVLDPAACLLILVLCAFGERMAWCLRGGQILLCCLVRRRAT